MLCLSLNSCAQPAIPSFFRYKFVWAHTPYIFEWDRYIPVCMCDLNSRFRLVVNVLMAQWEIRALLALWITELMWRRRPGPSKSERGVIRKPESGKLEGKSSFDLGSDGFRKDPQIYRVFCARKHSTLSIGLAGPVFGPLTS